MGYGEEDDREEEGESKKNVDEGCGVGEDGGVCLGFSC